MSNVYIRTIQEKGYDVFTCDPYEDCEIFRPGPRYLPKVVNPTIVDSPHPDFGSPRMTFHVIQLCVKCDDGFIVVDEVTFP